MCTKTTYERFSALVDVCKRLRDEGHLQSGFRFFIEDGCIYAKPAPPANLKQEDTRKHLERVLTELQHLRVQTALQFDLSAGVWENSPIGKFFIDTQKKAETILEKIEDGKIYDPYEALFLLLGCMKLFDTFSLKVFHSLEQEKLWKMLNKRASAFFTLEYKRTFLMRASTHALFFIALSELKEEQGGEAIDKLIAESIGAAEVLVHKIFRQYI